jgi:hypothetical protein
MRSTSLLAFLIVIGLLACGDSPRVATAADKAPYRIGDRLPQAGAPAAAAAYKDTMWEALVPADWNPGRELGNLNLESLSDADPRAVKALEQLRNAWNNAPVVASLNGARVRIPGFIVPLENQRGQITEFLLVPYFGACIHTPPPPSNQIIHVLPMKALKTEQTMDAVWVSGVLETTRSDTGMGSAGYRMKAEAVVPYRKP